jgi:hypothetical protein
MNKQIIRMIVLWLSVVVFVVLAGSTVSTQAQCGQRTNNPTSTGTPKPQSDMSNMDMSKMDMGTKNAGNMDMSNCPCPNCKSGGCANGSCSLKNHIAAKTIKSRTSGTKRRSSRAQTNKKTP